MAKTPIEPTDRQTRSSKISDTEANAENRPAAPVIPGVDPTTQALITMMQEMSKQQAKAQEAVMRETLLLHQK